MTTDQFTAFYPSPPVWACQAIDHRDILDPGKRAVVREMMAEPVHVVDGEGFTIRVHRDCRIELRIPRLERDTDIPSFDMAETVERWGEYLAHLNCLYLLLDSACLDVWKRQHFRLHEVTWRDAFRVSYCDGEYSGESLASESVNASFQHARLLPTDADMIRLAPLLRRGGVLPVEVLESATINFSKASKLPKLVHVLADFAKSLSEYKTGNYETSIVLSWFIIEKVLNRQWEIYVDQKSGEPGDGVRINAERKKTLLGRDFTANVMSNVLELADIIPNKLFREIDRTRGYRNKVAHDLESLSNRAEKARTAISTACSAIELQWHFRFTPSYSYALSGL